MYVWEVIAHRLRLDGWHCWHQSSPSEDGSPFYVHLRRPGVSWRVAGPTLTEAFAEAARWARSYRAQGHREPAPHLGTRPLACV